MEHYAVPNQNISKLFNKQKQRGIDALASGEAARQYAYPGDYGFNKLQEGAGSLIGTLLKGGGGGYDQNAEATQTTLYNNDLNRAQALNTSADAEMKRIQIDALRNLTANSQYGEQIRAGITQAELTGADTLAEQILTARREDAATQRNLDAVTNPETRAFLGLDNHLSDIAAYKNANIAQQQQNTKEQGYQALINSGKINLGNILKTGATAGDASNLNESYTKFAKMLQAQELQDALLNIVKNADSTTQKAFVLKSNHSDLANYKNSEFEIVKYIRQLAALEHVEDKTVATEFAAGINLNDSANFKKAQLQEKQWIKREGYVDRIKNEAQQAIVGASSGSSRGNSIQSQYPVELLKILEDTTKSKEQKGEAAMLALVRKNITREQAETLRKYYQLDLVERLKANAEPAEILQELQRTADDAIK